ncbi:MAG: molybdenum cofactor guanylyltransferase [Candidatus Hermodarchaeota archaeon]
MSKISNNSKYLAITILIGGKSTRFGNDKGLFELNGKPLISYQLETLSQGNFDIFLVAHSTKQVQNYINNIEINKILAFVIDEFGILFDSTLRTPLLGLYSGFRELNKLGYEKSFVIPCDLPLIQFNVVKFMIEQSYGFDCCIPCWKNGLLEPLFTVYPIEETITSAEENFNKKDYKLVHLLKDKWKINYISIEKSIIPLDKDLISFINVNEQSDLEKIQKKK